MQMHRQSLSTYGAPLCETIVEAPRPQGTEVLVRVERCGVCHSDLHMQDGYFLLGDGKKLDVQAGRTLPFTLGHEIAGLVESIGPDADVKPGAKVAVYPWIGCGRWGAGGVGGWEKSTPPRPHGQTGGGGVWLACPTPPYPLPQGEGEFPVHLHHRPTSPAPSPYVSIRMRGSIIASAMSDSSVPTIVRNE